MNSQNLSRRTWVEALSLRLTRHWKEKFAALVLAFFFWNMVKQQIRTMPRNRDTDMIRDHSIQDAAGFAR